MVWNDWLRPGEVVTLELQDLHLPSAASLCSTGSILLRHANTGQRLAIVANVLIGDPFLLEALQAWVQRLLQRPGLSDRTPLFGLNTQLLRWFLYKMVDALHLNNFGLQLCYFRRGGATPGWLHGLSAELVLLRGRWKHFSTAHLYLAEGRAWLAGLVLSPSQARVVRLLSSELPYIVIQMLVD